jgi:hypothetical protein
MKTYRARMLHGRSGAEGIHDFEGPDDLFDRSPLKIMAFFMAHATEKGFHEHEDYEAYSALKSRDGAVVTVSGEFHYTPTSRSPFICMIAEKEPR